MSDHSASPMPRMCACRSHPVRRVLEARCVQDEHQVSRLMVAAERTEVPIACTAGCIGSALLPIGWRHFRTASPPAHTTQ